MFLQGFKLHSGYIFTFEDYEFDLHNDYNLLEVLNQPLNSSARITFRRTYGEWVNESQAESIVLHFERVSRFLTKVGNPELINDRHTISFIGFLYRNDEAMDGYLEDLTDPSQDLIVGMEDESAVKIQAELVTLSLNRQVIS